MPFCAGLHRHCSSVTSGRIALSGGFAKHFAVRMRGVPLFAACSSEDGAFWDVPIARSPGPMPEAKAVLIAPTFQGKFGGEI